MSIHKHFPQNEHKVLVFGMVLFGKSLSESESDVRELDAGCRKPRNPAERCESEALPPPAGLSLPCIERAWRWLIETLSAAQQHLNVLLPFCAFQNVIPHFWTMSA